MIKGNQTRMFCKDIMNLYLFFKISIKCNLNRSLLKTSNILCVTYQSPVHTDHKYLLQDQIYVTYWWVIYLCMCVCVCLKINWRYSKKLYQNVPSIKPRADLILSFSFILCQLFCFKKRIN